MHKHTLRWVLPIIAILTVITVAVIAAPLLFHTAIVAYQVWP